MVDAQYWPNEWSMLQMGWKSCCWVGMEFSVTHEGYAVSGEQTFTLAPETLGTFFLQNILIYPNWHTERRFLGSVVQRIFQVASTEMENWTHYVFSKRGVSISPLTRRKPVVQSRAADSILDSFPSHVPHRPSTISQMPPEYFPFCTISLSTCLCLILGSHYFSPGLPLNSSSCFLFHSSGILQHCC